MRSNQAGHLLVRASIHLRDLPTDHLQEAREQLVKAFCGDEELGVASLYLALLQPDGKKASEELLAGQPYLKEEMLGRHLLLGPDSFLQSNHSVAELLVGIVKARIGGGTARDVTLLDLCCGGGFYSLHLAGRARGCVGVDVVDIRLAVTNAQINGLTNCSFVTGKVSAVIGQLAKEMRETGGRVMALLNPGRAGVEVEVVQELRKIPLLTSLIYVSCEPEDRRVMSNLVELVKEAGMGDRKAAGAAFTLTEVIPLDMFPNTHHCEHVFVFKRKPQ